MFFIIEERKLLFGIQDMQEVRIVSCMTHYKQSLAAKLLQISTPGQIKND